MVFGGEVINNHPLLYFLGYGEYDFTQDIESRVWCLIWTKYWHLKSLSYLIASLGWICGETLPWGFRRCQITYPPYNIPVIIFMSIELVVNSVHLWTLKYIPYPLWCFNIGMVEKLTYRGTSGINIPASMDRPRTVYTSRLPMIEFTIISPGCL
ncbi:Uncharacterised protein [Legionella bozemanae]|nr:Uncharacterised protein [Legionella bozemanae]